MSNENSQVDSSPDSAENSTATKLYNASLLYHTKEGAHHYVVRIGETTFEDFFNKNKECKLEAA